jgi:hypothetical protein
MHFSFVFFLEHPKIKFTNSRSEIITCLDCKISTALLTVWFVICDVGMCMYGPINICLDMAFVRKFLLGNLPRNEQYQITHFPATGNNI